MEQSAQDTQPAMEFSSADQTVYAAAVTEAPANITIPPPFPVPHPHPFVYQQEQQSYHLKKLQLLDEFWKNLMQEMEQTTDNKNHSLPLTRIKKIMKADEDVQMISPETPVIFAKACEIFIRDLTLQSWILTEENRRRTVKKKDIAGAISRTNTFDFLVDIVPGVEEKEEGVGIPRVVGVPSDQMPYYYNADPAAVALIGTYGIQDPPAHADPAVVALVGAYGIQDPHLIAYMLQQPAVQATTEAAAGSGSGTGDPEATASADA